MQSTNRNFCERSFWKCIGIIIGVCQRGIRAWTLKVERTTISESRRTEKESMVRKNPCLGFALHSVCLCRANIFAFVFRAYVKRFLMKLSNCVEHCTWWVVTKINNPSQSHDSWLSLRPSWSKLEFLCVGNLAMSILLLITTYITSHYHSAINSCYYR